MEQQGQIMVGEQNGEINIQEQPREIRVCKRCGKDFPISNGEADWLAERNLELPTHCRDCRRIRKEEKEAAKAKLTGKAAIEAAVRDISEASRTILAQTGPGTPFQKYLNGEGNR